MDAYVMHPVDSGFAFDLVSGDVTLLASKSYVSKETCKKGMASVRVCAPAAHIEDHTGGTFEPTRSPKFEITKDADGFRFSLKARNGQVVAVSPIHDTKDACLEAMWRTASVAAGALVRERE